MLNPANENLVKHHPPPPGHTTLLQYLAFPIDIYKDYTKYNIVLLPNVLFDDISH